MLLIGGYNKMKYYVIAGEMSGDLHSSMLIKEIKERDNEAEFRCWGGDMMKQQGVEIVKHIKDLAFMGFLEVIANLKTVLHNLSFCKKDIIEYNPDAIILTDYPGFNLKIAKFAYSKGFKIFYYISPQVWAWKKGRIKVMRKILTKLYVILPFEKAFYKKHNMEVEYYGNPLLDEISEYKKTVEKDKFLKDYSLGEKPIIAILPGSRKQEIKAMLPIQLSLVNKYDKFDFVVAGVNNFNENFYKKYIGNKNVKLIFNHTYDLLNVSYAAVVTSGTATLETALFDIPQVVCYKTSAISYNIIKLFTKMQFISLVNIILKRFVVVELLQNSWNEEELDKEFKKIAFNEPYRQEMEANYSILKNNLGSAGASKNIAKSIVDYLNIKK